MCRKSHSNTEKQMKVFKRLKIQFQMLRAAQSGPPSVWDSSRLHCQLKAPFSSFTSFRNSCLSFCCLVSIMCLCKNLCSRNEPFSLRGRIKVWQNTNKQTNKECAVTHWAAPGSIKPPSCSRLASYSFIFCHSSDCRCHKAKTAGVPPPADRHCETGFCLQHFCL